MKCKIIAAAIALIGGSACAGDFVDTAQVISSKPVYERVSEQRQDCSPDSKSAPQKPQQRNIVAPIIGGIAGALLGRQVGHGNGQTAATAVGAAVGTMAGDAVANPDANHSYAGAAVGAVGGGLLGSQIGNGRGNTATTAAGTIAGTMIGDRVGTQQSASAQAAQRCRTVESSREVIRGYDVVYSYNGHEVTTNLPYDPGNTVKVGVGIIDDERGADSRRDTYRDGRPVSSANTGDNYDNRPYRRRSSSQ